MLTNHQKAARARFEKQYRIKRLCIRLDSHVAAAEKLNKGKTREGHLKAAEIIRAELRELDH